MGPAYRRLDRTGQRIGAALSQLPHADALRRAEHAATLDLPAPGPEADPEPVAVPDGIDAADYAADRALAAMVHWIRRAPIPPSLDPAHGYLWCGLKPFEFTDMNGWPEPVTSNRGRATPPEAEIAMERTILAARLLMGQTIVRSEPLAPPRATRRRIARDQADLNPGVRYIDLRRARTAPADTAADDTGGAGPRREYRHRWVVRGHWRNQYYPSREDHRPIWIAPHLAGPDDKPLLGGERVNVLRR